MREEELESCWQETTDCELRMFHFVCICSLYVNLKRFSCLCFGL